MSVKNFHVSGEDLLLCIDGELSPRRAAAVRRHLSACWTCRARMADLEHAVTDFIRLYRHQLGETLPPIEGPRALLKARLSSLTVVAESKPWLSGVWQHRQGRAFAALFLVTGLTVAILQNRYASTRFSQTEVPPKGAIPDGSLTPGATTPISAQDVCSAASSTNDPAIPDPLRREALKHYGSTDLSGDAYQIDYLVTPQLGGAANIRNLWPEPSLNAVWNARVKDALEDRLHSLVCSRQLDLATAQREISQNWIAAYKKYFHTNEPLQEHSGFKAIGMQAALTGRA